MFTEQDIENALNALNAQLIPNYTQISLKFGIDYITLLQRYKGIFTFKAKATALYYKLLTNTQKEHLINQINKLIIRGLPLTLHIIKNFIKEIIGQKVNKN
jgi:predicted site-specific integrase-resolvase